MAANKPSLDEIFGSAASNKPALEDIFGASKSQAPVNPLGDDATPAQVIRNAAMGRIERAPAEEYLRSVGIEPDAINRFGKNASTADVLKGLAMKPAQGLTAGFADEFVGAVLPNQVEELRRLNDVASVNAPVSSLVGEAGGAVVGGLGIAAKAPALVKGIANVAAKGVMPSLAVSSGTGALSGAVYGAGNSEGGLQERMQAAGDGGLFGGIAGPAGALAGRIVAPLTERAMRVFGKAKPAAKAVPQAIPENAISRAPKPLQQPQQKVDAATVAGSIIPLTKGQATQSPDLQALENMARSGAIDDAAQAAVLKSDYTQQDALQNAIKTAAGGEPDAEGLVRVGSMLKQGYKAMKGQVNRAYDNAEVIRDVFVDKKPISEAFVPQVENIMRKQGFDYSNISPDSRKLLEQVQSIKDPKITAVNLEKMEFWRRKVSNRVEQLKGDPESVMMGRVLKSYDDFMAKLPEGALRTGDESALKAINEARSLRRLQGVLFERDKVVSKIVKNDELTNEELANLVLTGSERSQSLNAGASRALKAMKRAAGEEAPVLVDNLRKGVFARILDKSMSPMQRAGTEVQMIAPGKLLKELDGLTNNKSLMNELFDEGQRNTILGVRNDLRKIVSEQPGARNYSNSAYTVLSALRRLPMGGAALAGPLEMIGKPIGDKMARDELEKSLAPVLQNLRQELIGQARLYGSAAAGAITGKQAATAENESE